MIPTLLIAGLARATTFSAPMTLDELAERSDTAVQGRVVAVETSLRDGRIWTRAQIHPDTGADVDALMLGGCLAEKDLCMTVAGAPVPQVGDRVHAFLKEGRVTGMSQGWFEVFGEDAVRDTSGLVFANGAAAPARLPLQDVVRASERLNSPRR